MPTPILSNTLIPLPTPYLPHQSDSSQLHTFLLRHTPPPLTEVLLSGPLSRSEQPVSLVWSTEGFFDHQITDQANFNLDENFVCVISALLMGFSMLMLTDLIFRLLVRARRHEISTHVLYRVALLTRLSNPLNWASFLVPIVSLKQSSRSSVTSSDCNSRLNTGNSFPVWQRVIIIFAGLALPLLQVALIFLATNNTTKIPIDLRAMPAFEFRIPTTDYIIVPDTEQGLSQPIVSRNGFNSLGRTFICAPISVDLQTTIDRDGYAEVTMFWVSHQIGITVASQGLSILYSQTVYIDIGNGTQYSTQTNLTPLDSFSVLSKVFERHGIAIVRYNVYWNITSFPRPSWIERFVISYEGWNPPPGVIPVLRESDWGRTLMDLNVSLDSIAGNTYIGALSRSSLSLTAKSRAFHSGAYSTYLEEYTGPLVTKKRPWLSVAGCIIMSGTVFVAWGVVVFGLKWKPAVDERRAWSGVFEGVSNVEEFGTSPEQRIIISEAR